MISKDFKQENFAKSPISSKSNSSGTAFNPSLLTVDINSTESEDEINISQNQTKVKTFKYNQQIKIENNDNIYSTDSETNRSQNNSNNFSNSSSKDSTDEQKSIENQKDEFDDFFQSKSDSDQSFGSSSSKNETAILHQQFSISASTNDNPQSSILQQNYTCISKQVFSIDDEIEDEISFNEQTFPDQINHSKSGKEEVQKVENNNDLMFFTSNKSYMSNSRFERDDTAVIEEPKTIRSTARKTAKTSQKVKRKQSQENQHAIRMEQLKQYAINFYHLDDPSINITDDEYDELIQILNKERKKHISERNFVEGDKMNKVINTVVQDHEKKKKKELQRQEYNKYVTQHENFLNSLKKFDEETEEILNQIEKKNKELIEDLQKKHDDELTEHYTKWMSESKIRQYNHASQRLLNHRKTVELLLNQCRFNEAKELQATIEQIEKEEEKVAAAQMQHDYEESLKTLNERQENEEKFLKQKCEMKINQTQQRRKIERMTFMNKEKKFIKMKEQVSSPDKLWNAMQSQRINQIYKVSMKKVNNQVNQQQKDRLWRQKDSLSRRRCDVKTLPPMDNSESQSVKQIQQSNLRLPNTARKPTTSTVIKLPPLKMKKPVKKSRLAHTAR